MAVIVKLGILVGDIVKQNICLNPAETLGNTMVLEDLVKWHILCSVLQKHRQLQISYR